MTIEHVTVALLVLGIAWAILVQHVFNPKMKVWILLPVFLLIPDTIYTLITNPWPSIMLNVAADIGCVLMTRSSLDKHKSGTLPMGFRGVARLRLFFQLNKQVKQTQKDDLTAPAEDLKCQYIEATDFEVLPLTKDKRGS